MRGPWDRQDHFKPFAIDRARAQGAGFYPEDLTADEFKAYVAAHPEQKDALESLTTVVVRDGDKLEGRPLLAGVRRVAEARPRRCSLEAAALTENKSLATFLTSRAAAFAQRRLPPERQGLDGSRRARRGHHRPVRDVRGRSARASRRRSRRSSR